MNDDITQSKTPDYLTWPLKRLQQEYFKLAAELSRTKLINARENDTVQKAERLVAALRECLGDE